MTAPVEHVYSGWTREWCSCGWQGDARLSTFPRVQHDEHVAEVTRPADPQEGDK